MIVEEGELPDAARGNPLYDRTALGRLEHLLIATLAALFPVTEVTVTATVEELVRVAVQAPVHRIALRARLRSTWWRYADAFAPPPGSTFLGRELDVAGGRLDLLWQLSSGALLADELKTGALLSSFDREAALAQARRQLAGALAAYGAAFVGIRVLAFALPEESFLLDAAGVVTPLSERSLW